MYRLPIAAAAMAVVWLASCQPAETNRPAPARTQAPDKAKLFGDPTLVPTRAGERARRELGHAQEIEAALSLLPAVERAQANVELPQRDTEPARVLVVVRNLAGTEPGPLVEQAQRVARSVVGPTAAVEVLAQSIPAPEAPEPPAPWLLMVAVLGLGFCSGVLVERARRMETRRSRRRPR